MVLSRISCEKAAAKTSLRWLRMFVCALKATGATVAGIIDPLVLAYAVTLDEALDNGQRNVGVPVNKLEAWEDGGSESFSACRFKPGARVRIKGIQNNKYAHLNGRGATVARVVDAVKLKYAVNLDEAMENGQRDVSVGEGNLEPEEAGGQ